MDINFNFVKLILMGAGNTIVFAILSAILGVVLAVFFLFLIKSNSRLISWPIAGFLSMLRGLPELIIIFFVFYALPQITDWAFGFSLDLHPFIAGVISLSLIFAAYATQSLRGAIEGIPQGQWDAGTALGLTKVSIFLNIILPQMWRRSLPGLSNQWLIMLKDTSLVSLIGVGEIMYYTGAVVRATQELFTWYFIAAFLYLTFTLVSNYFIARLNKYFNRYLALGV